MDTNLIGSRGNCSRKKMSFDCSAVEFSQQSIVSIMDRFVKAVANMNENILVPRALMDGKVGFDSGLERNVAPKSRSFIRNLQAADLYNLYQTLNSIKTELTWASSSQEENCIELTKPQKSKNALSQNLGRRPSSTSLHMSSASSLSAAVSDTESEIGAYWTYRYDLGGEQGLVFPKQSTTPLEEPVAHLHSKGVFTSGKDMTVVARRYDESGNTSIKAQLYDPLNDMHLELGDLSESGSWHSWYSSVAKISSAGGESRKICIQGRGVTNDFTSYISDILLYIDGESTNVPESTIQPIRTSTGDPGQTLVTTSGPTETAHVTSEATITPNPTSSPTSCALIEEKEGFVFMSPNFPENFPAGAVCNQIITIDGALGFTATFNLFHVPSPYDPACENAYLSIGSGLYTERFCGYKDGITRIFNTSIIEVVFLGTSDATHITDAQFKITFTGR